METAWMMAYGLIGFGVVLFVVAALPARARRDVVVLDGAE